MEKNVGGSDELVRVLAGAVAGVLSLAVLTQTVSLPALASPVLGVLALVLLVTGSVNVCPLYSALGVGTRRR
ncbi:MAG: protein of unknown function (DUF2892) [halophilic archaeon J07HB67]|jgi:Protein of unknown function (DUF2892).|nr:MAG: protein of unknown function (DUF2892) [halophilic archaeon J07HB67]